MEYNAKIFSSASAVIVSTTLIFPLNSIAKPWLDTGDMRLRHEVQLLSDTGILSAPVTTWPLSTEDIDGSLQNTKTDDITQAELKYVINSVKQRLADEDQDSSSQVTGDFYSKKLLVRDFSGEGREKYALAYDFNWSNSVFNFRLKANAADASSHPDDDNIRFDESYVSTTLGNWRMTAGSQSRWWGPGWDGSLILSNNARPFPSLSIENVYSKPFKSKYLRWLGTHKLHMFVGQLESNRVVPDAKITGGRFTFRPLQSLEIGLHRTVQFGGQGQANGFDDFIKTVFGLREDSDDGQLTSVRGNQIAGLDARWNLPIKDDNKQYSLYMQYIGEDRVEGSVLLGDEVFLVGGSMSGISEKLGGTWRAYLEATDTSAGTFKGRDRNNIVYNNFLYQDGYRFLDVSLGHSIDSNSRLVSMGVMLSRENGDFWRGWAKHARINLEGGQNPVAPNGTEWAAIGVSLDRQINQDTRLDLGLQLMSEDVTGQDTDNDIGVSVGFTRSF